MTGKRCRSPQNEQHKCVIRDLKHLKGQVDAECRAIPLDLHTSLEYREPSPYQAMLICEDTNDVMQVEDCIRFTVGRSHLSSYKINCLHVSRHHFDLMLNDDGLTLSNLSARDTFVNAEMVYGHIKLYNGDIITIAHDRYMFRIQMQNVESEPDSP